MEVEVMAKDTKNLPAIEKEINEFLDYQNLTALDSKGMVKYIQGLNAIKKLRVDFTKTTVEKWYKKWKDYVFCLK